MGHSPVLSLVPAHLRNPEHTAASHVDVELGEAVQCGRVVIVGSGQLGKAAGDPPHPQIQAFSPALESQPSQQGPSHQWGGVKRRQLAVARQAGPSVFRLPDDQFQRWGCSTAVG